MGGSDKPQSAESSGKKIGLSTSVCAGRLLQEMPLCITWLVALAPWHSRVESPSHQHGGSSSCLAFVGGCVGEIGSSLNSLNLSGSKSPQKLTGRLCLLKNWYPALSPSVLSAARWSVPCEDAGFSPLRVFAECFLENETLQTQGPQMFSGNKCICNQDCLFNKGPQVIIINC